MNQEQIQALIATHEWYQTIPLAHGIATPGKRSPQYLQRKLEALGLPDSFGGASVLDIGTKEGFFAIETQRRGAGRVLGIDISAQAEAKFALVKSITGHSVEFRRMSVSDLDPRDVGTFDVVLFLSVFHHLRHPFFDLDRIAAVTQRQLILEIYVLDDGVLSSVPALYRGLGESGLFRLIPTRQFLVDALRRVGFREVEFLQRTSRRTFREIPVEVPRMTVSATR